MAIIVPAVTIALPIIHAFLGLTEQQLHPTPLTISGMVCASPGDMKGIYQINSLAKVKTADAWLGLGRQPGFACQMLKNMAVLNGGPVPGPDGRIEVAGGAPLP